MATDPKPGGGTALADDEYDYKAPTPAATDDEYDYHAPAATAPKPVQPVEKPKSWLGKAWDAGVQGVEHSPDPSNLFSRGAGAVGDWANKKAEEARTEEQKGVAAGGNAPAHPYLTPSAGYDLLARGAKTISGATSPAAAATTAATIAAPEIAGPAMLIHGGMNAVQGAQRIARGNTSPENVGDTLNSALETVGGLGVIGHQVGTGQRGPINQAIADRNPIERGTQAYQDIISPNGTSAAQQVEDLETMRRARPYLAEEARRNPVLKKQPNNPTDPNAGRQLGVANYRQNAGAAADRLWTDKIEPLTKSYGKAPVDGKVVAQEIRATINPDSPVDAERAQKINDLADFYEKTSTVEDATKKIRAINEDRAVQAYEKALPDKQAEMIAKDPTLEAKIKAANVLRDGVFDSIDKNGSPQEADYLREARKDFGALREVSTNLGKAQVPTPTSTGEKVIEAGHTAVRPISRTGPTASRLFSNPNRLAAKSSRLFGASDLQPRVAPPLPAQPWAPTPPPGFIAPPGAPQAPPPVPPQYATQATGSVTGTAPGMRGGGAARIAGVLPEQAASLVPPSTATPPVDPYFRYTGIGSVTDAGTPITGNAATGTRFGPRGLLPGPIHGTPVQPVGGPPLMGFPNDQGMWNLPPAARVEPSFETLPPRTATPAPGQVLRPGGLGTIADTETPNPYANRTPPELDRPKPAGGVEHGVQRRTMFEKEADAKAAAAKEAKSKPAEKPTDEQYTEAKNALKTPATLEPEELKQHRATVKAYDNAGKEQTAKDVEEVKKTGTANDRPQVKYKPSEKVEKMSEDRKPLGKEFDTHEDTHERMKYQNLLDNDNASEEEKKAANDYFEQHPDEKFEKRTTGENRPPARNWKGAGAKTETGAKTEIKTGENLVGAAQKTATLRDASGKEVGNAMLRDTNENGKRGLQVSVSQIEEGSRGQGLGKQMYHDIVDHARQNGYDYVESDKQRTPDANRVWESLKNSGEPVRMENGRYVLDVKKAGGEAAPAAGGGETPKISTDSNGIKWAEKTVDGRNIKVSVPKRIPDAEVNDYANKMIGEQAKGQSEMHSNLFGKKNSETSGASVDQVFGRDKAAEEKATAEHGERREANRAERLRDISENAQRVFEGKEPTPVKSVSWLKMGAERANAEVKPVQHEFTQEEIRNGELAALADAEATLQSDKPGRYFDERENDDMRSQKEQSSAKGKHAFGTWRGVTSGREMYPVLSRLPDMSATEVQRALRNPKSPAYQKVVRAAIEANKAEEARSARLGLNKEK